MVATLSTLDFLGLCNSGADGDRWKLLATSDFCESFCGRGESLRSEPSTALRLLCARSADRLSTSFRRCKVRSTSAYKSQELSPDKRLVGTDWLEVSTIVSQEDMLSSCTPERSEFLTATTIDYCARFKWISVNDSLLCKTLQVPFSVQYTYTEALVLRLSWGTTDSGRQRNSRDVLLLHIAGRRGLRTCSDRGISSEYQMTTKCDRPFRKKSKIKKVQHV